MTYLQTNKSIRVLIILLLFNMAALGTMLYIHLTRPAVSEACEHRPQRLNRLLEFDEEQTLRFNQLRNEHKSESKELRLIMRDKRENLIREITSEKPDTIKIFKLNHELAQLNEQMQNILSTHLIRVRAICNNEQAARFDSTISHIIMMQDSRGMHPHKKPPYLKKHKHLFKNYQNEQIEN